MSGWFLLATLHALLGSAVVVVVNLLSIVRAWRFRGSRIDSVTGDMRRWLIFAWLSYSIASVYALVGVLVTTRWH